jgi:hypothetical protein
MKKPTPQEIYEEALRERAKDDPLKKRQACEKGWLAVTEAVDQFLDTKGKYIPKGTADTHVKRNKALADLVGTTPEAQQLVSMVAEIADQLHGTCFYGGEDSEYHTTLLRKTVRQILKLTGFWNGSEDE